MRKRADILLVERGLCETRTLAQRLIAAGKVRTGPDAVVRKAGDLYGDDTGFTVEQPPAYVSRGAYKLLAALEAFPPPLAGCIALDVGASTGGFTDLLLQRGAARVYAVDVGTAQLHPRLRADPRVVCLEQVNARRLGRSHVPEAIDVLTMDLAFISVRQVLPACAPLLRPGACCFVLVKPQFEAGRHQVGRGGVVRDPAVRELCVREICLFAEEQLGWTVLGTVPSPILGPAGNQETMAVFRAGAAAPGDSGPGA
jgi:23S rRNA (cytidine1920-2'-O)/16S rRNA (cytidine1409-2'-O)-methyltransferase